MVDPVLAPLELVERIRLLIDDDGMFGLTLLVGRLTFDAQLSGLEGQRAMRDFVVVVQSRRSAPASV
jgi:hypothetical protein